VTADVRPAVDPVAATAAQLDQELAQQLMDWVAEDRAQTHTSDRLTGPLIEAVVWVAGAVCIWIVVAVAIRA
jgi:hypothetical protein